MAGLNYMRLITEFEKITTIKSAKKMVYIFSQNGSHNNKVHAIHFCKIKLKRIIIKRSAVRVKFTHVWQWWIPTLEDWKRKFFFRHKEWNDLQHQISVRQSCPWSEGVQGHFGNGLWQCHATVPQKARKQNILKGQVPYLATCTAVLHSVLWNTCNLILNMKWYG